MTDVLKSQKYSDLTVNLFGKYRYFGFTFVAMFAVLTFLVLKIFGVLHAFHFNKIIAAYQLRKTTQIQDRHLGLSVDYHKHLFVRHLFGQLLVFLL